jgi:rhamnogalacturonyl hydrolase YesR
MLDNLQQYKDNLVNWIEKNGYKGWDPYDVQGSRFYTKYLQKSNSIFHKVARVSINQFNFYTPFFIRKILNIKPQINAKAMALLSLSFIKLYNLTNEKKYYDKYNECINWLLNNNHSQKENTLGWGYPFDWHSLIFIPKQTPLCVPTVLVGHALLDEYEYVGNEDNKENIIKIKNFLISLNITKIDEDKICFSYSNLDDYMVINANLYTASFLTRYAKIFDDNETLQLARKSRNFAISQQETDGSWPYWSKLYKKNKAKPYVDNYHTGIKLQWLKICNSYDYNEKEEIAIKIGTKYYYQNLFTKDGLPKVSNDTIYPIDIHGPAQAFVTFNYVGMKDDRDILEKVYNFVNQNMRDKDGFYYYKINKFNHTSKIPYMRWAEAWMLYGLVNLIEYKSKDK